MLGFEKSNGKEPTRKNGVPDYDAALIAYHHAFRKELGQAIAELPLRPDARILDVPCGDGFYSRLLAQAVPEGMVVGADLRDEYLERHVTRARGDAGRRSVVQSNVYHLPFADGTFDLVWCAQSLISLKHPVAALNEMRRVVRPGGWVAVMENDTFHQLLLPWPIELELAVQRALQERGAADHGSASKLAPARSVRSLFLRAGIRPVAKKTYAADRQPPYSPAVRKFLTLHLRRLREQVASRLPRSALKKFEHFSDPRAADSIVHLHEGDFTCLNVLFLGMVR